MTVSNVQVTPAPGVLTVTWVLGRGDQAAMVKWRRHPTGSWNVGLGVSDIKITGLLNGVQYDVQIVSVTGSGVVSAGGTPISGSPPTPMPPYPVVT